ncbi:hypothetical protein [Micromonospora chokoriensis]|uniref:hypothetical protein n=1 Tax=Micromonospora chokoriensis TaxID=356851 RepID=UPI000563FDAB|nr:hypothetical protein [Micromonospora chokoriensis]
MALATEEGTAEEVGEPTKTGPSGGGTRDAVQAALPTTTTATRTPHNGRSQDRITRQIIAEVNEAHCPSCRTPDGRITSGRR